jgi:hypothetical protein
MFAWSTTLPVSGGKLKAKVTPIRQRRRAAAMQDVILMGAEGEFAIACDEPRMPESAPLNLRLWVPGFTRSMSFARSKTGLFDPDHGSSSENLRT